jgi:hypothetical protein
LNPPEITRARCQSTRLEKPRCPQPFIHTNRSHDFVYVGQPLTIPTPSILDALQDAGPAANGKASHVL